MLTTGKWFASEVEMVAGVRDGLIAWSRNYSNPLTGAIAFDVVGGLLAGLTAS